MKRRYFPIASLSLMVWAAYAQAQDQNAALKIPDTAQLSELPDVVVIGTSPLGTAGIALKQFAGNVYVADTANGAVKKIDASGHVTILNNADFQFPTGVAVDALGNVYVADIGPLSAYPLSKIDATTGQVSQLGSGLLQPAGVAVDASGNVFIADTNNNAIKMIASAQIGAGQSANVVSLGAGFSAPFGIAVDGTGKVYVADTGNNCVKKITLTAGVPTIVTLVSGFNSPYALGLDASGTVYVSDAHNNLVKTIAAGSGAVQTLGSGFNQPLGFAFDSSDNVYVACLLYTSDAADE